MDELASIGFYTLEDSRAATVNNTSPLWRCELLLTARCNFRCPYCRGTDPSANITFDYAKYIVDLWDAEGLKNIRFSGGEPTCVPWLSELISYTKDKTNIKRIALSTNGSRSEQYYSDLLERGVNDFSISLDACCSSFGEKMSGVKGAWETVVKNIEYLSRKTYVTVGCVFDETNVEQSLETILLAHNLGVSDIRIISAAQFNKALGFVKKIPNSVLDAHPILKYRVINFLNGRNVRGICKEDNHRCPLVLDDMAIKGQYHYPCIIKMREGCLPIGKVTKNMREERLLYFKSHNTFKDIICRQNCLDVCIDYNNRVLETNTEINN